MVGIGGVGMVVSVVAVGCVDGVVTAVSFANAVGRGRRGAIMATDESLGMTVGTAANCSLACMTSGAGWRMMGGAAGATAVGFAMGGVSTRCTGQTVCKGDAWIGVDSCALDCQICVSSAATSNGASFLRCTAVTVGSSLVTDD
jgi:hypothetical protein